MKEDMKNNRALMAITNYLGITRQQLNEYFEQYITGLIADAHPDVRMASMLFLRLLADKQLGLDPNETEDFLGHLKSIYEMGDEMEKELLDKHPLQDVMVGELAKQLNLDVSRSRITPAQLVSPIFNCINPN